MSEEPMRTGANPADPLPPSPVQLPAEIHQPGITEQLLNAQLAESLLILRDAAWLYRTSREEARERGLYVSQSTDLMRASAELAGMIGQLRSGGARQIHQRMTIERIQTFPPPSFTGEGDHVVVEGATVPEGGGGPKNEKRLTP